LKEYKRLGLYLKDKAGRLIRVDDPKLDPVWRRCGELGMPLSIHVAIRRPSGSPTTRERALARTQGPPQWWFGTGEIPPFHELLAALDRVIERTAKPRLSACISPTTPRTSIGSSRPGQHPNMHRRPRGAHPEIGRHDRRACIGSLSNTGPHSVRHGFHGVRRPHARVGRQRPAPTAGDAIEFYERHWRWFETSDRQFEHMTPIQGDWRIDAIDLPASVLRKIYFDNARRLLVRSLPLPVLQAKKIDRDFKPNGRLNEPAWRAASPVRIECFGTHGPHDRFDLRRRVLVRLASLFRFEAPYETSPHSRVSKTKNASAFGNGRFEVFLGTDRPPDH
jgi:hypothetical protein